MDNDSKKALFATLKEVWHKMDSNFDYYAKSMGINFPAVLILQLLLDATEAYTQKDICEKLGLPKQLVFSIIKPFWEQGYVELKEAKDRRNKDVFLTDTGKEYALSILQPLEDAEAAAWANFSDEDFITFVRIMEKYAEAFGSALKKQ
jgi:DNA-binding MarR family transcriptional regulator